MSTAPDAALFREAVSRFATGITVVTCQVDDADHAMTANAFSSVSLDPLLVLVCVERATRFHEALAHTDVWGVSILARSAEPAARWLATKGRPLENQLASVDHYYGARTGSALISGALATLECRTFATHPAGDHDVVIGQVVAIEVARDIPGAVDDQSPLLYYRRGYRHLTEPESTS